MLGIFRIVIGLPFALHGSAKLFGWPVTKMGAIPTGTWPDWYAGLIELVVGVLVLLGLFTRIAALLGSGTMAYAYFTEHQPNGLFPIQERRRVDRAVLFRVPAHRLRRSGLVCAQPKSHVADSCRSFAADTVIPPTEPRTASCPFSLPETWEKSPSTR